MDVEIHRSHDDFSTHSHHRHDPKPTTWHCCRPSDGAKVAPAAQSGSKAHGTKYAGRLDPLAEPMLQRAKADGLELFATVREPRETPPAHPPPYADRVTCLTRHLPDTALA